MNEGLFIGFVAIATATILLSLSVSRHNHNTELNLEQKNERLSHYEDMYYEIMCFDGGATVFHDWSETDLKIYPDGRLEYTSVTENRVVALYFDGVMCKSIPPIQQ
jgi:hypothetical protein